MRELAKRVGLDVIYMPPSKGFSKIVAMCEYLSGFLFAKGLRNS